MPACMPAANTPAPRTPSRMHLRRTSKPSAQCPVPSAQPIEWERDWIREETGYEPETSDQRKRTQHQSDIRQELLLVTVTQCRPSRSRPPPNPPAASQPASQPSQQPSLGFCAPSLTQPPLHHSTLLTFPPPIPFPRSLPLLPPPPSTSTLYAPPAQSFASADTSPLPTPTTQDDPATRHHCQHGLAILYRKAPLHRSTVQPSHRHPLPVTILEVPRSPTVTKSRTPARPTENGFRSQLAPPEPALWNWY